MNQKLIITLILTILFIIFLVLAMFLYVKDKSIKENSTKKTVGWVIDYSYNQTRAPVVEYSVDKNTYSKALKYSYFSYLSNSFASIRTYAKDDLLDTKLRIRSNRNLSLNTLMSDRFPIGSKLDVYYNPKNPKEAFVERFSADYTWVAFLGSAILVLLMNISYFWLL